VKGLDYDIFAESVKNHRTMVFRIAFSYAKDTHDAEDITQDVFLKLYKTDTEFAADENVKAWLIRVTVNQAKSLLKTVWKSRRVSFSGSEDLPTVANRLPDDCLELYQYVDRLKPKYRNIIYLYYYEQYSVKEVAVLLKIRETTVTTQLNRARNQLREILLAEGYV
jgi:RNA polymerase sigma-70 factor (ECF subfamily)